MIKNFLSKIMLLLLVILGAQNHLSSQENTEKKPVEGTKEPMFFYWKDEIKDIVAQRNELQKKYDDLFLKYNSDISSLRLENDRLKAINSALEKERSTVAPRSSQDQARISQLEKDLATKTSSEKQAQDRIKSLESQLASNAAERSSLNQSIQNNSFPTTTTQTTPSSSQNTASREELIAQINSLTNQRDQLQRDIAAIYGYQKTIVINQNQPSNTTIPNNTNTTSSTQSQSEQDAIAKANRLEQELIEMTKKRDKLQKDLDSLNTAIYNSEKNPLYTSTTTTVTTVEEARVVIQRLDKQNAELTAERDKLKQDLAKSNDEKKTLEAKLKETSTTTTTVTSKTTEEMAKDAKKVEDAKSANDAKIAANEKEIAKKLAELEDKKKEIESLTKEIAQLKEDKEALESDLAHAKEAHEEENLKKKEEIERLTLQAQKLEEALEKEIKKNQSNKPSKEKKTGKETSSTTVTTTTEETDTAEEDTTGAKVYTKGARTIISLSSRVNFESGSNKLTAKGKDNLNRVLKVLRKYSAQRIYIEGNTDNQPLAEGSKFRDNWHLSFERALSVLNFLGKDKSLKKTKFAAAAFAERNPIKPNTTKSNRAANRRVDIVVVPK
jgi:chemotaxis protein MotB